jgi:Protein of unknown function (DUF2865)
MLKFSNPINQDAPAYWIVASRVFALALGCFCLVTLVFSSSAHNRVVTKAVSQHPTTLHLSLPLKQITHVDVSAMQRAGQHIQTNDTWNLQISDPAFWAGRRSDKSKASSGTFDASNRNGSTKSQLGMGADNSLKPREKFNRTGINSDNDSSDSGQGSDSGERTFRTMCVRLCDGYFWPISFSTTDDNFERDQKTCERSCEGPVKLYTYRNPGSDLEEMEDLKGQPYKKLQTAFLFRKTYEASCKCKPHPWEQEAQDRHRVLALEARKKNVDAQAALELKDLKSKVTAASIAARASAKAAIVTIEKKSAANTRTTTSASTKSRKDRADNEVLSTSAALKPSIPSSDGVVVMRLGTRPAMSVKPEARQSKRPSKQTVAGIRRSTVGENE